MSMIFPDLVDLKINFFTDDTKIYTTITTIMDAQMTWANFAIWLKNGYFVSTSLNINT